MPDSLAVQIRAHTNVGKRLYCNQYIAVGFPSLWRPGYMRLCVYAHPERVDYVRFFYPGNDNVVCFDIKDMLITSIPVHLRARATSIVRRIQNGGCQIWPV